MSATRCRVCWLACALLAAGCSDSGAKTGYERYVPSEEAGRAALDAALTAWQSGRPIGRVAAGAVPVEVVDAQWAAGERLESFAILGETAGNFPRCFAVRLQLAGQRQPFKTRFAVFGQDPLWVFRHDDLEMMVHMDHPAEGPTAKPK